MLSVANVLERLVEESLPLLPNEVGEELERLYEERTKNACAKVLLYGPYNAGKTVLINALAGREVFKSGPTPETSVLQPVRFAEYEIVDSPGFGAPDATAEQLSRRCARWDADLVLFVVTPSQYEDAQVWQEVRDLLGSGRALILVINEFEPLEDDERERIGNAMARRLALAREGSPGADAEGPWFVNAMSGLRARKAIPIKTLLEEQSRIGLLEDRIHHWLAAKGRYAALATVAAALRDALKKARVEVEAQLIPPDSKAAETLARLDQIREELEKFVETEVMARATDIAKWARAKVFSAEPEEVMRPDDLAELIEEQVNSLIARVDALLARRLAWVAQETSLGELKERLKGAGQEIAEAMRTNEAEVVAEPIHTDLVATGQPAWPTPDEQRGRPSLFQETFKATTMLKQAGMLRSLARMGKLGKTVAKGVRYAPVVAIAVDGILTIVDIINENKRLEQARKVLDKQVRKAEKREREFRNFLVEECSRRGRDAMQIVGDLVLTVAAEVLLSRRRVIQDKLEADAKAGEAVRERLAALNRLISDAERFLDFVRRVEAADGAA